MGNRSSRRPRLVTAEDASPRWHGRVTFVLIGSALSTMVPAIAVAATAAGATGQAHVIAAETQRFLLFYAGVFALLALTAAVGAGLVATDRIIMSPGYRVLAQAVHRAVSLIALSALATHIMLEIIVRRASAIDAVVPFLAGRANFYMGVGTVASDLFVLIVVTGIARRRFAGGSRQWVWRGLHTTAYACWPLAVLHGLLAGRAAKPYVDWSYGACLAAAGLVLAIRFVATVRGPDTAAQPVPDRASWPMAAQAIMPGPADPVGRLRQSGGQLRQPGGQLPPPGHPASSRHRRPGPGRYGRDGHPARGHQRRARPADRGAGPDGPAGPGRAPGCVRADPEADRRRADRHGRVGGPVRPRRRCLPGGPQAEVRPGVGPAAQADPGDRDQRHRG